MTMRLCVVCSPLNNEKRMGTFVCAGCDAPLFRSDTKYNSGEEIVLLKLTAEEHNSISAQAVPVCSDIAAAA